MGCHLQAPSQLCWQMPRTGSSQTNIIKKKGNQHLNIRGFLPIEARDSAVHRHKWGCPSQGYGAITLWGGCSGITQSSTPFPFHAGLGSMPSPDALASIPRIDDTAAVGGAPDPRDINHSHAGKPAPIGQFSPEAPLGGCIYGRWNPPCPGKVGSKD